MIKKLTNFYYLRKNGALLFKANFWSNSLLFDLITPIVPFATIYVSLKSVDLIVTLMF